MFLDASLSDGKTPSISIAPIDYTKTKWTIKPLDLEIDQSDIVIRPNSMKKKLEFLVRKPGTYEATCIVVNKYGEESEIVTKEFTVDPDEKPLSSFNVDAKKVYRDPITKKATVKFTDSSLSTDNDTITQRIWSVEYDSNNDGYFGTPADAGKQVIDSSNKTSITYSNDKVGNYRFSLQVKESYGQPTYQEFIQDEHYLRDSSDKVDEMGEVAVYQLDENFNIPDKDKLIIFDNAPPTIDFAMFRKSKVDIVLNFAGLDIAAQQHDRTSYGNNDRYYRRNYVETREHHKDHYYHTYNTAEKNTLTSQAGDLQADLISKGIDARIVMDNSYYRTADADGVGERNIPVWGLTEWYVPTSCGSQSTTDASWTPPSPCYIKSTTTTEQTQKVIADSSYSPTPPWQHVGKQAVSCGSQSTTDASWTPASPCFISSTSTSEQTQTVMGDINYSPPSPWQLVNSTYRQFNQSETNSTGCSPPSGYYVESSSYTEDPVTKKKTYSCYYERHYWEHTSKLVTYNHTLQQWEHTIRLITYHHELEKQVYNSAWEIQYYNTVGVNSIEQVDTTDFVSAYQSQTYRSDADKFYIRFDKTPYTWMNNSTKKNSFLTKSKLTTSIFGTSPLTAIKPMRKI